MKTKLKDVERFDTTTESKIKIALNKLFTEQKNDLTEEKAINIKTVTAMDEANVCMVVAISDRAKIVLTRFIDTERELKVPELDYTSQKESKSLFSTDYLLIIFNVLKLLKDDYKGTVSNYLCVKYEYPLTIENKDFKFILAPKVENE